MWTLRNGGKNRDFLAHACLKAMIWYVRQKRGRWSNAIVTNQFYNTLINLYVAVFNLLEVQITKK